MDKEDIKKIEAINESTNPQTVLLANIILEAQRQHILALNTLCYVADVMMGKPHGY